MDRLDTRALAKLHWETRCELRTTRLRVRSWYATYEPLDLSFRRAWRRVPEILIALRELRGMEGIDDQQLQLVAWIASALTASDEAQGAPERMAYVRARRALERALVEVESAEGAAREVSPEATLEMLEAGQSVRGAQEALVDALGHRDPKTRPVRPYVPITLELFSYLVSRILVCSAGLTKARAEVQIARIGPLLGWRPSYQVAEGRERDDSSAVRHRIQRFQRSPRWPQSGSWQVLLWAAQGVPPERSAEGARPPLIAPAVLKDWCTMKLESRSDLLDMRCRLRAVEAVETNVGIIFRGAQRDVDRCIRELEERIEERQQLEEERQQLEDDISAREDQDTTVSAAEAQTLSLRLNTTVTACDRLCDHVRAILQAFGLPEIPELTD